MQATPRSCLLMPGLSTCTVCITRWRWLCVRRITTPSVRVGCWFVGSSWIARGFKLEEFSKDKMMEIWDKEDEDEMEMQTAMGLNNLAEKMEIIQAEKDAQWNLPRLARDVRQALGRMAVSTAKGAKDGAVATMWKTLYTVEPTFMRRCVRLRQPCGAQLSARGAPTALLTPCCRYRERKQDAKWDREDEEYEREQAEKEAKKAAAALASRLARRKLKEERNRKLKEEAPARRMMKRFIRRAEEQMKDARVAEARARFAAAHDAVRKEEAHAIATHNADIARQVRQFRSRGIVEWGRIAADSRDESRVLFKSFREKKKNDARTRVLNKLREESAREERLKREHDNIPDISSRAPFAVMNLTAPPMLKGEYLHKGHTGGHQPLVDDTPVKLFTAQPDSSNVRFEMTNMAVQRLESRMHQVSTAYHKRHEQIQASLEEEETLREKGMKMMEDLAELEAMEARLQAKLDGPPQRNATHAEIISSHNRKTKRARVARQRVEISSHLDKLRALREKDEKVANQLARWLVRWRCRFCFYLVATAHTWRAVWLCDVLCVAV